MTAVPASVRQQCIEERLDRGVTVNVGHSDEVSGVTSCRGTGFALLQWLAHEFLKVLSRFQVS